MQIKAWFVGLFFFSLLVVSTWLLLGGNNSPAPDVKFTTISGKHITLKAQQGKPVIVTFWATDCPACIKEIPHLIELRNMTGEEELMIIGISSEKPNKLTPFATENKINYPIIIEVNFIKAGIPPAVSTLQMKVPYVRVTGCIENCKTGVGVYVVYAGPGSLNVAVVYQDSSTGSATNL